MINSKGTIWAQLAWYLEETNCIPNQMILIRTFTLQTFTFHDKKINFVGEEKATHVFDLLLLHYDWYIYRKQ